MDWLAIHSSTAATSSPQCTMTKRACCTSTILHRRSSRRRATRRRRPVLCALWASRAHAPVMSKSPICSRGRRRLHATPPQRS